LANRSSSGRTVSISSLPDASQTTSLVNALIFSGATHMIMERKYSASPGSAHANPTEFAEQVRANP
jgi:hypothetical protein